MDVTFVCLENDKLCPVIKGVLIKGHHVFSRRRSNVRFSKTLLYTGNTCVILTIDGISELRERLIHLHVTDGCVCCRFPM